MWGGCAAAQWLLLLLTAAAVAVCCLAHARSWRALAAAAATAAGAPSRPLPCTLATSGRLVVASYNAHLLPFPVSHDGDRRVVALAAALPRALAHADVLVLSELISGRRAAALLAALAPWWPHQSGTTTAWARTCGGVRVLSRLPILRQATHVYAATDVSTSDALAAKGAVYVRLDSRCSRDGEQGHADTAANVPPIHLLATHMHAPNTAAGDVVRAAQRAELAAFLAEQAPRRRDVVLLAGDLNHDLDGADVRAALRVQAPVLWRGRHRHSVDPRSNSMAGIDGSRGRDGVSPCAPRLLDGALLHAGYGPRAVLTTQEVVPLRDDTGADLSDHHAVVLTATFN